jgi:hypothetical protein
MVKLKSAKHHWWPRCVSRRWAAEDGKTGWIRPDGSTDRIPPKELGAISNGHHVKFGRKPEDSDVWDFSFEKGFDAADSNFPSVITWLEGLDRKSIFDNDLNDRFLPQSATDEQLSGLTESIVSLAVRSPMNREASVAVADLVSGVMPTRERNNIIGLNMRTSQRIIADAIGTNAKFAVLFSNSKEFIYGDGFFHNVRAVHNYPHTPKMLVPITPNMSVIINRPTSFMVEPRLSTLILTGDEVDRCNQAVQVYSRQALFFRREMPILTENFICGKHLHYENVDNPIDNLLRAIPGIPPRNKNWLY